MLKELCQEVLMDKEKKSEDLGIKLGSDDMVFWRNLIDAKEMDIKISKDNIKVYQLILDGAKKKYKEAEEEFKALA